MDACAKAPGVSSFYRWKKSWPTWPPPCASASRSLPTKKAAAIPPATLNASAPSPKGSSNSNNNCPRRSIRSCATSSSAAATAKCLRCSRRRGACAKPVTTHDRRLTQAPLHFLRSPKLRNEEGMFTSHAVSHGKSCKRKRAIQSALCRCCAGHSAYDELGSLVRHNKRTDFHLALALTIVCASNRRTASNHLDKKCGVFPVACRKATSRRQL